MGYLKTGLPKALAVLSCCAIVAGGSVGFAAFDKSAIQSCDVNLSQNKEVEKEENSVIKRNEMGDVTVAETTAVTTASSKETSKATTTSKATSATTMETTSTKAASIYYTTTEVQTSQTTAPTTKATTTTAPTTTQESTSTRAETTQTAAATKTTTKTTTTTEETTTTTKKTTTAEENTQTDLPQTDMPETVPASTTTTAPATTTSKKTTTTAPATTTKKTTTTTATVVNNGTTAKSRLNAATLKPNKTLSGNEDKILTKYLDKIIDDDMTNYEKAVACYDYLIKNTYYAYGGWSKPVQAVLEEGYGTCTEYSYVLAAMMNYIGFSAKTVDGYTAMAAGGYGYHMWVEVKINGVTYVMDAQVDDNMSWGSTISHDRFVKTYDEVAGKYIKN